ncbi:hypothetical protein BJ138DRAFT_1130188 [Hygrophoropsis aurantiaca]|uniref:Uncharacterized protein n=1 Tax=Hygrophoropsis aurantiaca TaxID=72124 RepID=A0ACB7ZZ88_9AGAM|nr:hypothetical protein BJ138DRAFT_1130188 [Hygrophoropsis aurantiaca]
MADPKAVTEEGAEVMDSNGGVDHSSLPTPGREASELTDDESAVYVQAQDEGPGDVQPSNGAPSVSQTILVKGAAYRTWQALIYYCYTGQTAFAPLKSRGVITARSSEHDSDATTCTPCSPKSMYRLADALGIDALKDAALAAIRSDLSKENILGETFSKFTSKYPAIQDMEVALLIKHRSAREVVQEFPVKIQMIFRGEIPHAEKAHADFMQRLLQI